MSWLVWRQHRGELLFVSGAVLFVAAFFVVVHTLLAQSYADLGIGACDGATTDTCRNALNSLLLNYTWMSLVIYALLLMPALLGMFVAAPLVAREFEAGTFRFAWMQSVTRSRWFWAKVLAVALASALAAAAVTGAVSWALEPLVRVDALMTLNFLIPMTFPLFDVSGTALVATTLLAIAAGTFFGAVSKRTVLAMVLTLLVFAGVRIPMNSYVRPNLLPPLTLTAPISVNNPLQLVPSAHGSEGQASSTSRATPTSCWRWWLVHAIKLETSLQRSLAVSTARAFGPTSSTSRPSVFGSIKASKAAPT